jgi:hypothetical protein
MCSPDCRWESSELPILLNGFDGPFELLTKSLGEELLNGHIKLLAENNSETRVDVVLLGLVLAKCTVFS